MLDTLTHSKELSMNGWDSIVSVFPGSNESACLAQSTINNLSEEEKIEQGILPIYGSTWTPEVFHALLESERYITHCMNSLETRSGEFRGYKSWTVVVKGGLCGVVEIKKWLNPTVICEECEWERNIVWCKKCPNEKCRLS